MPDDGPRDGRASARSLRGREVRAVLRVRPLRSRRVAIHLTTGPGFRGVAVVASRKVGGAVARNRARRILRAAWRRVSPRLREPVGAVLVARPDIVGAKTGDLVEEVEEMLARAGMIE